MASSGAQPVSAAQPHHMRADDQAVPARSAGPPPRSISIAALPARSQPRSPAAGSCPREARPSPPAPCDLTMIRASSGLLDVFHERPAAHLDIEHNRVGTCRQLLARDAAGDQRQAGYRQSRRGGVQLAVGRRQALVCPRHDPIAHLLHELFVTEFDAIAGNRFSLSMVPPEKRDRARSSWRPGRPPPPRVAARRVTPYPPPRRSSVCRQHMG